MVQSGQFLERPTLIESGGFCLEGLWHRGGQSPALLICPPHPSRGMSMDAPVCAELAFAVSQRGHPTLRFNYRGVGASQGPLSGLAECVEDARAALGLLRDNVGGQAPLAVAGFDHGALVALELSRAEPASALVLVSPPEGAQCLEGPRPPGGRLIVLGERDHAADRRALGEACSQSGDSLVVIAGADRLFGAGLAALGRAVARFLSGEPPEDA